MHVSSCTWLPGSGIFGFSWCCGDDGRRFGRLLWFAYPFSSWSQNHTQVSHWRDRCDLNPHPHEWVVCLLVRAAVYFLQSRILFCCHSPLACWKSSNSSVLPHDFQWQRLRLFESWNEWVWMTGKLDDHRHSPGLLGGAFLWSENCRQHRWWTAQGQGMIPVVLQWSTVSFLKEFL